MVKKALAFSALCLLAAALTGAGLEAQPAAKTIALGGLAHLAAPGFEENPVLEGCAMVRVDPARPSESTRRDCRAPRPPWRGQVLEWLEARNAISLYPAVLTAGENEPPPILFGARGTASLAAGEPAIVDFFQLDSFRAERSPRPEFHRRVEAAEAKSGVALPAGLVFALESGAQGTLLTRPATLAPGAHLELVPRPPAAGRADLLLVLERGKPLRFYDRDHEVWPTLGRGQGGETRRPDVISSSGDRVIALFFDLPAGSWQLAIASAAYELGEQTLTLRAGEANIAAFALGALPHLTARLDLPAALRRAPFRAEVFDLASGALLFEQSGIDPRSDRAYLGYLPPLQLNVRLQIESFLLEQQADLRSGEDREIVFAPQPIVISGILTRDGEPVPGFVTFATGADEKPNAAPADGGGHYETTLYRPGLYPVYIDLEGIPTFIREVQVPEQPTFTLDFDVPGNTFAVTVVDTETQEPVPGAVVQVEHQGWGLERLRISLLTGEEGRVALPPMDPGQVVIAAQATGYLHSPPSAFAVGQLGKNHEIRIQLDKVAETTSRVFVRPDGQPASGLEIRVQGDLGDAAVSFESFTDENGQVLIPNAVDGGYVLWRDHSGRLASGFFHFSSEEGNRAPIAVPAATSLVLQVVDRGGAPLAGSPLLLWQADGERHGGESLQYLFGANTSDANGFVRLQGLAPAPLRLLSYDPAGKYADLEPLASALAWPWPAIVQLERAN